MESASNFRAEDVEPRGALCVECMGALGAGEALVDRCGAALCRACAAEFYAPCAGCGGLVARDEALTRADADAGALFCGECYRSPSGVEGVEALPDEAEVERLVARYVALHAEKKRIDEELDEVKELLKLVAGARTRVANAVLLRAGDDCLRCSYSVRTTWDAEKLSAAEHLLGEEFASLFERKVSFTAVRSTLDAFLDAADDTHADARSLIRSAAQASETATINVVAPKKKKKAEEIL